MKKIACTLFLGIILHTNVSAQRAPAGGGAPAGGNTVQTLSNQPDWANPMLVECEGATAKLPSKLYTNAEKPIELPIELVETKEADLVMFDQKGREIFRVEISAMYLPDEKNAEQKFSKMYGTGWNATYQGKILPKGTYYYMVDLEGLNAKKCRKMGRIEIVY
jgi:hypothetical protein